MLSSTSNSSSGDINMNSSRKETKLQSYLRKHVASATFMLGAALFVSAVLLFRGFIMLLLAMAGIGGDPLNARISQGLAHLPDLVAENSVRSSVIVFGSSLVEQGFSPVVFDNEMRELGFITASYNYGFGGLNPEYQRLIVKRMKEKVEAEQEKIDLVLIEFNPFQTTLKRKINDTFMADQRYASFSSIDELWDITTQDPERGVRLFTIRFLRGQISAELITGALGLAIGSMNQTVIGEEHDELVARRKELEAELVRLIEQDGGDPYGISWDPEFRGGRLDADSLSKEFSDVVSEFMSVYRHPVFVQGALERRISCCDIVDLGFDEFLIVEFIEMVRIFQTMSDRVEIILLPQNHYWVKNPPETKKKLAMVLDRISRETGVVVKNYQRHTQINKTHYMDASHLTPTEGAEIFTRTLVQDYKVFLSAHTKE